MQKNKTVKLLEKTYIKANGVTLYEFLSSDTVSKYFITVKDGAIDGETHQDCKGYHYRGTCAHTDYIMAEQPIASYNILAAAVQVLADAEIGDAYEHMPKVIASYTFSATCRHCGGNHHSNECPY